MVSNLPGQAELEYGAGINYNLLNFMGPLRGTVLDIGCGSGAWAPLLREAGASRLKGLEPTAYASTARERFDEVVECPVEDIPAGFAADADTVIFADVLEHVVDPWQVMADFRAQMKTGAQMFISLPNFQNFRIGVPLLTRGRFTYSDLGGPMDRGHLRWFTRDTLRQAVTAAGWRVEREDGYYLGRVATAAMRVTRGAAGPFVYHQLHLGARAS